MWMWQVRKLGSIFQNVTLQYKFWWKFSKNKIETFWHKALVIWSNKVSYIGNTTKKFAFYMHIGTVSICIENSID